MSQTGRHSASDGGRLHFVGAGGGAATDSGRVWLRTLRVQVLFASRFAPRADPPRLANENLCMTLALAPRPPLCLTCRAPHPVASLPHTPSPASAPRPVLQRHPKSGAAGDPILLHVQDCVSNTELIGIHVDERLDVARHQL